MSVAGFLITYVMLALLSDSVDPPDNITAYVSIVLFGLLLSGPFALPLVFAALTARIASRRYLQAFLRSGTARATLIILAVALLGFLQSYLWVNVQGLEAMIEELLTAIYIAGIISGIAAAYFTLQTGGEFDHE